MRQVPSDIRMPALTERQEKAIQELKDSISDDPRVAGAIILIGVDDVTLSFQVGISEEEYWRIFQGVMQAKDKGEYASKSEISARDN